MKAVVLAAGAGKRMYPLTQNRPKVMLPLAGRPLLEWNLKNAKSAGITDIIMIVGYKDDVVKDYFLDGSRLGLTIKYVNQGTPQGTGHAVGCAEPFLKSEESFLCFCGDTIFGEDDFKTLANTPNSIGVISVDFPEQYGVVEKDSNGCLLKIHEKSKNPPSNLINSGLYHLPTNIFSLIKKLEKSPRGEYELTDALTAQSTSTPLHLVELNYWRDVVYPWDLLDANKDIVEALPVVQDGIIEEGAVLKGAVSVGKDSIIRSGSYIEGPVYIGDNCKVGPNCYIRAHTSIGSSCHIGAACEVKNTILFDHSNIPHHNYVGDSVIGSHCNLGSGTKVANLRLDKANIKVIHRGEKTPTGRRKLGVIMGDHTQTGINANIDCGTIIGPHTFIGPGAKARKEISEKSRIL